MALSLLVTSVLIGCSTGDETPRVTSGSECSLGTPDPVESVRGFLSAVQNDSQESARKFLKPGLEIPPEAWTELAGRLEGVSLDALKFTGEPLTGAVALRVILEDGSVLGTFQAHFLEDDPECAAVAWGTYPEDPDDAASQPAST